MQFEDRQIILRCLDRDIPFRHPTFAFALSGPVLIAQNRLDLFQVQTRNVTDPKNGPDLWVLPMTGDRKPIPFLQTEFRERQAQFSPDGKWVVYMSNESGNDEVYVQSFPPAAGKWKISTNGGAAPRWRGDGQEIFFLTQDRKLWSVKVKSGQSSFEASFPELLFETRITIVNTSYFAYNVSADGQRFPITTIPGETASTEPITVVVNWHAGLSGSK
jgi:dipeptidyl aminopeptidase/acylaminoacyl peptidase